jgi:ABC-2 type transport system ATP-binding protein
MTDEPLARARRLRHDYGDATALAGIDFDLPRGRVTALLGPNGAGKTTLIHLLIGLLPLQHGTLRLFGGLAPDDRACRSRLGVMLQRSGVQDNLRVGELLALFGSFYADPEPAPALIEEAGLAGLEQRRFDRLSGGQRQRVLFALAAVGRPDLLVLDEPTSGLDPSARRRLWQAIETRRRAGASILLCTHFIEEAERLADHVIVLDRGRVRVQGSPDDIRRRVPQDTVRVRTSLSRQQLAGLPGVLRARIDEDRAELLTARGVDTVRALLEADPTADRLEVRGADLEDAFLALTRAGETRREAA